MYECIQRDWATELDVHKDTEHNCENFDRNFGTYFPTNTEDISTEVPDGRDLVESAKHVKCDSSSGSDGWRPAELKWLPIQAWDVRAEIMKCMIEAGHFPQAYMHAYHTAIPKCGKDLQPMNQRLLTILVALYRIESRAIFAKIRGDLVKRLHTNIHGAVPCSKALAQHGTGSRGESS